MYAETSQSRPLSTAATLRSGGYYDGRLGEQVLTLTWRPSAHWGVAGTALRQDVRLQSGRFIVRTASLRLDHAASARSTQSLVLQHGNVSEQTALGLRARWEFAPGRELLAALDRVRPAPAAPDLQTRASIQLLWNWER